MFCAPRRCNEKRHQAAAYIWSRPASWQPRLRLPVLKSGSLVVSLHLVTTAEDLERNRVAVRGLNVAFFGVSQNLLSGGTPVREPLGLLGFAVISSEVQTLHYDRRSGQLSGELRMFADASFLNAYAEPIEGRQNDQFETPVVPVAGEISLRLEGPLPSAVDTIYQTRGVLDLSLRSEGLRHKGVPVPGIRGSPAGRRPGAHRYSPPRDTVVYRAGAEALRSAHPAVAGTVGWHEVGLRVFPVGGQRGGSAVGRSAGRVCRSASQAHALSGARPTSHSRSATGEHCGPETSGS